jgi:ERCC4-related helicase
MSELPAARAYQTRIARECSGRNAIVVLPTGAGKTFIASMVIKAAVQAMKKKAVFLVPTCMLVKQQSAALEHETCLRIGQYHGGLAFPTDYDVLVSTPSAFFAKDLPWDMFCLFVFDEVHHVSKDHPYRKIALKLLSRPKNESPQVLGLSASLTYAVDGAKIKNEMSVLAAELRIEHMATATNQELREGGYHANTSNTIVAREDVLGASQVLPDPMLVPVAQRAPHQLLPEFWKRVEARKNTRFTSLLLNVVRAMEAQAASAAECNDSANNSSKKNGRNGSMNTSNNHNNNNNKSNHSNGNNGSSSSKSLNNNNNNNRTFASPMKGRLADWGVYAKKKAGDVPICRELEHWYEALRLNAASWEEECELPVLYLNMTLTSLMNSTTKTAASDQHACVLHVYKLETQQGNDDVRACVQEFNAYVHENIRFPRLDYLAQTLLDRKDSDLRAIVFVQQKIATHILTDFINTHTELRAANITATHLYAVDSPATASFRMTKSESQSNIERFRTGQSTVLVATTVAEEGMDVPCANCVIRYDPIHTPVSLVQGRGRARQENSDFIVMKERTDRSVQHLSTAENHLAHAVVNFAPNHALVEKQLRDAQISRERGASDVLTR